MRPERALRRTLNPHSHLGNRDAYEPDICLVLLTLQTIDVKTSTQERLNSWRNGCFSFICIMWKKLM